MAEVNARDRAMDGLRGAQKQQVKNLRKKLVVAADNLVVAREEIQAMDQLIRHHEGGRKMYYLLCPVCQNFMVTMGATPILYWLPERQSSESVREGLTVADSEEIKNPKLLAEIWKQDGFLKMRNHVLGCLRAEKGKRIKEKDLPPFYRKPSHDSGDNAAASHMSSKKRRVSFD